MVMPVISPSAFTEVKLYSKARLDAAKERVDSDVEKLIKATQEAIQRLEIENAALKSRIVVLEENSRKEALIKKTAHELLQKELHLEKEHRLKAEVERNFLLEVFKKRKPKIDHPIGDLSFMWPDDYQQLCAGTKALYDDWEKDWQDFLKLRF